MVTFRPDRQLRESNSRQCVETLPARGAARLDDVEATYLRADRRTRDGTGTTGRSFNAFVVGEEVGRVPAPTPSTQESDVVDIVHSVAGG